MCAEGNFLPPACGVEREAVMLSRIASHSCGGYRAAKAVLLPRGPPPPKLLVKVSLVAACIHPLEWEVRCELGMLPDGDAVLLCAVHALIQIGHIMIEDLQALKGTFLEDLGGTGAFHNEKPSHQILKKAYEGEE